MNSVQRQSRKLTNLGFLEPFGLSIPKFISINKLPMLLARQSILNIPFDLFVFHWRLLHLT